MLDTYGSKNILQLPYLNDEGNAICVTIGWHDARQLLDAGTHRRIHVDGDMYVVTPIAPAVTDYKFQREA
jgi:hypothetical protein